MKIRVEREGSRKRQGGLRVPTAEVGNTECFPRLLLKNNYVKKKIHSYCKKKAKGMLMDLKNFPLVFKKELCKNRSMLHEKKNY